MSAFATKEEVATRTGETYTTEQQASIDMVLEHVTGLIVVAVGKTDAWADELIAGETDNDEDTPGIPRAIKAVTIEATIRAISNPGAVDSETETLGAYSKTTRFTSGGDLAESIYLSDGEERICRMAAGGASSGTALMGALLDELPEWRPFPLLPFPLDTSDDDSWLTPVP